MYIGGQFCTLCCIKSLNLLYSLHLPSPGLKEDFQSNVFKVLAAILHLGNVEIRDSGGDKSSIPVSPGSLLRERPDGDDGSSSK